MANKNKSKLPLVPEVTPEVPTEPVTEAQTPAETTPETAPEVTPEVPVKKVKAEKLEVEDDEHAERRAELAKIGKKLKVLEDGTMLEY
jgi:hypothetical protein